MVSETGIKLIGIINIQNQPGWDSQLIHTVMIKANTKMDELDK